LKKVYQEQNMGKITQKQDNLKIKSLIKEGFYWEAAGIAAGQDFELGIFNLLQKATGDSELVRLLHDVRMDFSTGNYPPARVKCDDFFMELGKDFDSAVLDVDGEIITRERYWWDEVFRPSLPLPNCMKLIDSKLTALMTKTGIDLINEVQERLKKEKISDSVARKGLAKAIKAFKIAKKYTDNKQYLAELLDQTSEVWDAIQLAKVEKINKRLEKSEIDLDQGLEELSKVFKSLRKPDSVREKKVAGNMCRNYGVTLINKADETANTNVKLAISQAKTGLKAIKKAREYGHDPDGVVKLIKQAEGIISSITNNRKFQQLMEIHKAIEEYVVDINNAIKSQQGNDITLDEAIGKLSQVLDGLEQNQNQLNELKSKLSLPAVFGMDKYRRAITSHKKQLNLLQKRVRSFLAGMYFSRGIKRINEGQAQVKQLLETLR